MPKLIPEEFKKSHFFKENPKEIKFTQNSFNEIYFSVEVKDGNETLLVHYPRNYAKQPEVVKISYDELMVKYPTVEKLINQFVNLIIFGIGGTFIIEEIPMDYDPNTFKVHPNLPLRNKIEKLLDQTQLHFVLSTRLKNNRYVNNLFKRIFSFDREESHISEHPVKDTFKGVQNNTESIDIEKIINYMKNKCAVLGIRNILIVNNPKLDIKNPDLLDNCIVVPDKEYRFLNKIDNFVIASKIDLEEKTFLSRETIQPYSLDLHLSDESPDKNNFSQEEKTPSKNVFQQKEKNTWLHYDSSESETENFLSPASEKTKNKKRNSDAPLMSEEWAERAKKSKEDKSEKVHENQSFQRSISEQWIVPKK